MMTFNAMITELIWKWCDICLAEHKQGYRLLNTLHMGNGWVTQPNPGPMRSWDASQVMWRPCRYSGHVACLEGTVWGIKAGTDGGGTGSPVVSSDHKKSRWIITVWNIYIWAWQIRQFKKSSFRIFAKGSFARSHDFWSKWWRKVAFVMNLPKWTVTINLLPTGVRQSGLYKEMLVASGQLETIRHTYPTAAKEHNNHIEGVASWNKHVE